MHDKHPIHTTISTEALRILERYEKEMGAKNTVLERALMGMDKLRFKDKIDPQSINRFIKRVNVGIVGVDELIEGGIPEGFIVVVTGPPGTGKTTFSLQYLMEGLKKDERCIYFSFEEKVDQIIKQSVRYGWDIGEYIDKGYLEIFGFTMLSSEEIAEIFNVFKPKRIVFDSLNTFFDIRDFRRSSQWRSLLKEIRDKKITCLAITEKRHGLEVKEFDEFDFMGDGVIFFDKRQRHDLDPYPTYYIQIQKMRITKINEMPHPFIFTEHGLELIGNRGLIKRFNEPVLSEKKFQIEMDTDTRDP